MVLERGQEGLLRLGDQNDFWTEAEGMVLRQREQLVLRLWRLDQAQFLQFSQQVTKEAGGWWE